jgi:hypothetical protein
LNAKTETMTYCNANLSNLASSYICSDYTMIERIRTTLDIGLLVVIDRKLKSNLIVENLLMIPLVYSLNHSYIFVIRRSSNL